MLAKKYEARGCKLHFSVKEDGGYFVADFFTEDGTFVEEGGDKTCDAP